MRTVFIIIMSISLFCFLVAAQNNEGPEIHQGINYEDIEFRVVNGKPATLGQFPYQVSFKKRKRNAYISFCGGSVIGLTKILTAGHCFTHQKNVCEKWCGIYHIRNLARLYAVAGTLRTVGYYTDNPSSPEQWRAIRRAVVADRYSFPRRDICLVFTYVPFILNNNVNIWPVASRKMDYGSIDCMTSGYGRISNWITSDSLLWASLRLLPMAQCSYIHGRNMREFICTSADVTNVLQGDSGGGLVCKNTGDPNDKGQGVIVGVVSGAAVTRSGYKTFFTRVTSYQGFINATNRATTNSLLYTAWLLPIVTKFV